MKQKPPPPRDRPSVKQNATQQRDQFDRELTGIVETSVSRVLGKVDALMVKFEAERRS